MTMQYRELEKLGIKTSLLGFGCMRFPTTEDGKIDEVRAEKMMDEAIKNGVNYIDTAYPYHEGESERFVGKVINGYISLSGEYSRFFISLFLLFLSFLALLFFPTICQPPPSNHACLDNVLEVQS